MHDDVNRAITRFLETSRLHSRQEALEHPSPIPDASGVYGWWFKQLPPMVEASGCYSRDGLTLLYVGISPGRPPQNGRPPSRQHLRSRIQTHYAGNAEGSTLRKTLGCLLTQELGIQLRRVGSGNHLTFVQGEQVLSAWMGQNAIVSWLIQDRPWELEDQLIALLDLPLNLEGNTRNGFHRVLSDARRRCVAHAKALPVVPNPGIGGR
jgi:hypothetical protein